MSYNNKIEESSSAFMKWLVPRERKITGIALVVTALTMVIFSALLAVNVFGCSTFLHYTATALIVGAIAPSGFGAYLIKTSEKNSTNIVKTY